MVKRKKKDLGELELAVLNAVFDRPGSSVREIAALMAEERGLARTTILTVMQRLHGKGFLRRRKVGAVYRYTATSEQRQVVSDLIGQFVSKTLGGSPVPFLAYLAESKDLTEDQIAQLREIVDDLERSEET
jgi:predicted transcriptional regulator